MKESIGGISLFQIVVAFILLFTAIMCLTINHSKAFAVKDEIINIIEDSITSSNSNMGVSGTNSFQVNGTLNKETIDAVLKRLAEIGYQSTGDCPDGWDGYNANGDISNKSALFCIKKEDVAETYKKEVEDLCKSSNCKVAGVDDYPFMYYYKVRLFYALDIPIVERMPFNVTSSTKVLIGVRKK